MAGSYLPEESVALQTAVVTHRWVRGAQAMRQMRRVAPLAIMARLVYPGGPNEPAHGKEVALMKRLVMLVAMLAMTVVLAVPAFAQGQVERGPELGAERRSYRSRRSRQGAVLRADSTGGGLGVRTESWPPV